MGTNILLAFGFGNLAMLGWLAAAAAPLLIHLWSRHRFREAPWAAMQFLLAAMRKNARRMQLQQWLLLAVRTMIIALVVLAVAEPYGEQLLAGGSGTPIHKILVVDGSYSMDYRDDGTSHFARAKQAAAALVRSSRPADTFTVILMAQPAKTILGPAMVDHAAVAAQIEALTQPHTPADLASTLTLVQESIKADSSDRKSSDRHEVYFFTDLQRTTWQFGSAAHGNEEPLKKRLAELPPHAALTVIDVGQPPTANLAVTSLTTSDVLVTVGREITLDVALRRFGDQPRSQCSVELLVDGLPVGEQTVDVPTGEDAAVRFTHRFRSAGEHTIEARAADDRLEIDNSRWLIVPVREEVRVLCISGRTEAARYVADALNPNPAGDSPIRPVVVSEGDLADIELSGFDCVFVCNVAQLTSDEAERLRRYAAAGGGIVFFLGDRVVRQSYNVLAVGKQPLLPAGLGELVSQPQFGLDPLEYRHPIVAPFRGRERAGLLTTPFSRYYRLEITKNRAGVEVAAATRTGDPFIVTAPLGRGRTVLIATDGSLASVDASTGEPWSNWPTWPSFLPVVRELLAYATSGQQQEWQQLVGTALASRRPGTRLNRLPGARLGPEFANMQPGALEIVRPDGRTAPVAVQSSPAGWEWSYGETDVSGIYSLRGLPDGPSQHFAVNVDTTESDLSKVAPEQLPPEFRVGKTWHDMSSTKGSASVSHAGLNEPLLWVALALLFVELFLAWQFGRGTV